VAAGDGTPAGVPHPDSRRYVSGLARFGALAASAPSPLRGPRRFGASPASAPSPASVPSGTRASGLGHSGTGPSGTGAFDQAPLLRRKRAT
jgi:hypothetical protein